MAPAQPPQPVRMLVLLPPPEWSPPPCPPAERAPLRQCQRDHQRPPLEQAPHPPAPSQQPPTPPQACSHRAVSHHRLISPRRLSASIRAAGRCHAALQPPHPAPSQLPPSQACSRRAVSQRRLISPRRLPASIRAAGKCHAALQPPHLAIAPPSQAPRSHRAVSNRLSIDSRCAPAATLAAGRCHAGSQSRYRVQLSMPSTSAAASAQRLTPRVAPGERRAATLSVAARVASTAKLALARSMWRLWAPSRQAMSCARRDRVAEMLPSTPTVAVS